MRVRDWMSPDPRSVAPTTTVGEARRLLNYYGVRHLPVVEDSKVVGMISDRDVRTDPLLVRQAMLAGHADTVGDGRLVNAVMSAPAYVVGVDETIEAAARLMLSRRISALPVVDDERTLVGIVTTTDCLLASLAPAPAATE